MLQVHKHSTNMDGMQNPSLNGSERKTLFLTPRMSWQYIKLYIIYMCGSLWKFSIESALIYAIVSVYVVSCTHIFKFSLKY